MITIRFASIDGQCLKYFLKDDDDLTLMILPEERIRI